MIEINLVPENMRKGRRVQSQAAVADKDPSGGLAKPFVFGILGVFIVLLVIGVLAFQFMVARQITQRNALKKEMASIEKDRQNIEKIIKQIKESKERIKTLEKVIGPPGVTWAEKLNEISDLLPRSVWLTKVGLEGKFLIIEGSAVSKAKTEIADVHVLIGKLESSKVFMANLKNLELDMIKTHNVENLSVADFKIKVQLAK